MTWTRRSIRGDVDTAVGREEPGEYRESATGGASPGGCAMELETVEAESRRGGGRDRGRWIGGGRRSRGTEVAGIEGDGLAAGGGGGARPQRPATRGR